MCTCFRRQQLTSLPHTPGTRLLIQNSSLKNKVSKYDNSIEIGKSKLGRAWKKNYCKKKSSPDIPLSKFSTVIWWITECNSKKRNWFSRQISYRSTSYLYFGTWVPVKYRCLITSRSSLATPFLLTVGWVQIRFKPTRGSPSRTSWR